MAQDPTVTPRWIPAVITINTGSRPTIVWQGQQGQPSFEAALAISKDSLRLLGSASAMSPAALKKADGKTKFYVPYGDSYKEV